MDARKVWQWIKTQYAFVVVVVVAILFWVLRRSKDKPDIVDLKKKVRSEHQAQVKEIEIIYDNEIKKTAEIEKKASERLKSVEVQLEKADVVIEKKKKAKVEKLLKKHADDPDFLTSELSKLTGIEVYVDV